MEADTVPGTRGLKTRSNLECGFVQIPFPLPASHSEVLVPMGTLSLLSSLCIFGLSDQCRNLLPRPVCAGCQLTGKEETWALPCACSLSVVRPHLWMDTGNLLLTPSLAVIHCTICASSGYGSW